MGSANKRKNNAEIKSTGRRALEEELASRDRGGFNTGDADPLNTVTTLNFENLDGPKKSKQQKLENDIAEISHIRGNRELSKDRLDLANASQETHMQPALENKTFEDINNTT